MPKGLRYLGILVHLVKFDIELKLFGFEKVFPKYIKRYPIQDVRTTFDQEVVEEMNQLMGMIDRACASYPFEAQCLHRSFLGYRFFRKNFQVPVELVIGVTKFPFNAHAWLLLNGQNFNESPEYTAHYSVIMNSMLEEGGVSA